MSTLEPKLNFSFSLWFSSPGQRLLGSCEKLSRRINNRQKNFFLRHSWRFSIKTIWRSFWILISTHQLNGLNTRLTVLPEIWFKFTITWSCFCQQDLYMMKHPFIQLDLTRSKQKSLRSNGCPCEGFLTQTDLPEGELTANGTRPHQLWRRRLFFFNPLKKYKWLVH